MICWRKIKNSHQGARTQRKIILIIFKAGARLIIYKDLPADAQACAAASWAAEAQVAGASLKISH